MLGVSGLRLPLRWGGKARPPPQRDANLQLLQKGLQQEENELYPTEMTFLSLLYKQNKCAPSSVGTKPGVNGRGL